MMSEIIRIHDDKKERLQSFTAKALINVESSYGGFDEEICGYGYNEEEARSELFKELIKIKDSFNKSIDAAINELS